MESEWETESDWNDIFDPQISFTQTHSATHLSFQLLIWKNKAPIWSPIQANDQDIGSDPCKEWKSTLGPSTEIKTPKVNAALTAKYHFYDLSESISDLFG